MKKYFININEKRLRTGWRIVIFFIIFMGISILGQTIFKAAYGGIPKTSEFLRNSIIIVIAAMAASIAVPLTRKFIDKKTFISLGYRINGQAVKDLLFGFLLSGFMAACVFLIMQATGLIEVTGNNWQQIKENEFPLGSFARYLATISFASLAFYLVIDIIVGWWEELVFRGYLLQNMIEGMGLKISILVSCLIYGIIHSVNPNAGLLSTLIIILFGYLRIYGYLSTGQLWLSIGMHTGWNYFQGPIFGYAASGHKAPGLIEQIAKGPDWLSGGEFGPEGSVLIIPIIGLAIFIMRWWGNKHKNSAGQTSG